MNTSSPFYIIGHLLTMASFSSSNKLLFVFRFINNFGNPSSESQRGLNNKIPNLHKKTWRVVVILGDPGAVSRVGKKGGTKVFKQGRKSPWVTTLMITELFPKIQAGTGAWLGTKNSLYYFAQLANYFSWVLFVSSYTTAIVRPHLPGSFTKLVRTRETFIFYFPNQKQRNYRRVEKTFGLLSARAIEFAPRIFCFWRITIKMRRRWEIQISNSLTRQNNNFARTSRFSVHFFAVNCTSTRENA